MREVTRARAGALGTVYLVAKREFLTRVRTRFFVVGTLLLMLLMGGYIVLQALVLNKPATVKVGFEGDAQVLAQPLVRASGSAAGLTVQTSSVADVATGNQLVRDGTLDAFVSGDAAAPSVAVKNTLNPTLQATLTALVKQVALSRALAASGADPAQVEASVAAANINLTTLDPNAAQRTQRIVIGIFVAALLYAALVLYGQFVAAGVVEEKANRIIEILLATVRPRQLLFGKVFGIGLMGLVQLVLVGAVALVAITLTNAIDLPSVTFLAAGASLVWFVIGFVFYALIFAAAGSLVSRQEDLGSVTGPISMLIVGTYLAFFWVVANPDRPLAVLLSVLPAFAPVMLPARIATGDATLWQVALALVLNLAAIGALVTLAARIYVNSVLRVGTRVSLRQAWRGAE